MLSGEACHVPAEDYKKRSGNPSGLGAAVDKVPESLFGSHVAEDNTVEELTLESFYVTLEVYNH